MQTIGLCRFSYPAIGGFQVEHASIEERIAYLYAADRLEERFALFETIALPCLKHQTDPAFELIVVVGDSLPKPALARLHDLLADLPQARIVTEPPQPQREVMKAILNKARRDPSEPCLQFRFDDDDAVAVDFIEQLHNAVRDCAALTRQHRAVAFDWNKGYIVEADIKSVRATEIFRPFYTAALAMHVRGNCPLTIMNFAHNKIPQFMPAVSFSDRPMFVRSHNRYNDSRQKPVKATVLEPVTDDLRSVFRDRFALDEKRVCEALSAR